MAKHILVIDDEELLVKTMIRLLEKSGYEVYAVKNGIDAQAIIEEEEFDLVISDIRMPGINGVETVRNIQKILESNRKKRIPVIFITGFADETIAGEANKLNPIAYFYKPFDTVELLNVVKSRIG